RHRVDLGAPPGAAEETVPAVHVGADVVEARGEPRLARMHAALVAARAAALVQCGAERAAVRRLRGGPTETGHRCSGHDDEAGGWLHPLRPGYRDRRLPDYARKPRARSKAGRERNGCAVTTNP